MTESVASNATVAVERTALETLLLDLNNSHVSYDAAVKMLIGLLQPSPDFAPAVMRQRDQPYAGVHYGGANSPYTIGGSGCLITAMAYSLNALLQRDAYTPIDLQDALAAHGGYAADEHGVVCSVIYAKVAELFPIVQFVDKIDTKGPDLPAGLLARIDAQIASGLPVLCKVDNSPITGIQQHWVALRARLPQDPSLPVRDYQIADSWWPDVDANGKPCLTTLLAHYPQTPNLSKTIEHAIEGVALYTRVAP